MKETTEEEKGKTEVMISRKYGEARRRRDIIILDSNIYCPIY